VNFADLKELLAVGVGRTDLEASYPRWINRALKRIQQDHDWSFAKSVLTVVVDSGTSTEALPSTFKCLSSERTPIYITAGLGETTPRPCYVVSYEHTQNLKGAAWPSSAGSGSSTGTYVFLQRASTGIVSLRLAETAPSNITFAVSAYSFLPDLAADDDENILTTDYEDLVEAKLKSIAFATVNDPLAADYENLYRLRLQEAIRDDYLRTHKGRAIRMGGD
jgi:hypothetical protein